MFVIRKRTLSILLIMCMLLLNVAAVIASGNITVCIDDQILNFDVPPQLINGRTMVPMRKIFEALGAVVTWDEVTQTVTGKKGDTVVNVSIDSKILFKNSVPKTLDVAPTLINSRTLVPVRAIAESFNCEVQWIEATQTVKIITNGLVEKSILTASEISEKVSPSVFYIEVYDENYKAMGSGSGFFISSDGVAVTNYHVVEDSTAAQIRTVNGEIYDVTNVVAFDEDLDVAIIKVSRTSIYGNTVSGFNAATLGDSNNIKAGQNIFALGSPRGLQNTLSDGIISNVNQIVDGDSFIQITAPISPGSSGGALVNEYGEVLGITSAIISDAQNIGLAIPINIIKSFDVNAVGVSYKEFSKSDTAFTLEVYPETLELEVGETANILVYAEGKSDDWSIFWHTDQKYVVGCEWGDWLEDYTSVCPLKITGRREGTAVVTIYSNVDFVGKTVTINVKGPAVNIYPSSKVKVPDYTSVTGVSLVERRQYEKNYLYIYNCYNASEIQNYINYITNMGFSLYNEEREKGTLTYYYTTPDRSGIFAIGVAYEFNQVWIYVPTF